MSTLTRTLRVQVYPDEIIKTELFKTMKEYSRAAQTAYNYAISEKTSNRVKIHHGIYKDFRKQSPLNSQLVINAKNKAVDVLKSLEANGKKITITFNSIMPIRYENRSSTIDLQQRNVSIATTNGRVKLRLNFPQYCSEYLAWEFRSFELVYIRKQFYVHFVVRSRTDVSGPHSGVFIGIDRGIRHLAVSSQNKFYSGSRLREVKNKYLRLKRGLQKKGTRSAKRKLKRIAGREKRFQKDQNHCISKTIIQDIPRNSTIILEDLSEIRSTVKQRKGGKFSRELHSWGFYQFQTMLKYKAKAKNIEIVFIDPAYTSQRCSKCGFTARGNRKGSEFFCLSCGFRCNADLNASHNIKWKFVDDSNIMELAHRANGMLGGDFVSIPIIAS